MARIEIKYKSGDTITVKLFQNRFTEDLCAHFARGNNNFHIEHCLSNTYKHKYSGEYDENVESSWGEILTHLAKYKDLGVKLLREVPNEFDFRQDTLNYLHRIFTYSMQLINGFITKNQEEFPFTADYTIPRLSKDYDTNIEEIYKIIEPINSAVHGLEKFTIPTLGAHALQTTNKIPSIYIKNSGGNDRNAFEVDWYDIEENGHYFRNFNFMKYPQPHLVCLSDTILGKSVLKSYKDYDNPSLSDCTGRKMTDGSFLIYPNRCLHDLYESDGFTSWLDKHNMDINETPLELAIGHVVQSTIPLAVLDNAPTELSSVEWIS